MIDIGRLNKRITFKKHVSKKNEYKQYVQELEDYKTVWASVEPISGKEFLDAQKIQNEITHNIYTRYFKDIDTNMIIEYKGRLFEISSIINYKEQDRMLRFVCVEKVGD